MVPTNPRHLAGLDQSRSWPLVFVFLRQFLRVWVASCEGLRFSSRGLLVMLIEKADVKEKSGEDIKTGDRTRYRTDRHETGCPCPVGSGGKKGFSAEPGGTAFGS